MECICLRTAFNFGNFCSPAVPHHSLTREEKSFFKGERTRLRFVVITFSFFFFLFGVQAKVVKMRPRTVGGKINDFFPFHPKQI